jgi:hypothetical protein
VAPIIVAIAIAARFIILPLVPYVGVVCNWRRGSVALYTSAISPRERFAIFPKIPFIFALATPLAQPFVLKYDEGVQRIV